jgi:hypothetical protein
MMNWELGSMNFVYEIPQVCTHGSLLFSTRPRYLIPAAAVTEPIEPTVPFCDQQQQWAIG